MARRWCRRLGRWDEGTNGEEQAGGGGAVVGESSLEAEPSSFFFLFDSKERLVILSEAKICCQDYEKQVLRAFGPQDDSSWARFIRKERSGPEGR